MILQPKNEIPLLAKIAGVLAFIVSAPIIFYLSVSLWKSTTGNVAMIIIIGPMIPAFAVMLAVVDPLLKIQKSIQVKNLEKFFREQIEEGVSRPEILIKTLIASQLETWHL